MQTTQVDYRNGPLFPMILRFSIPVAISLLITAVYNIVDRIFVGNWVGTSALAGLSVCFPLSYMMMAFGLMCSAGGSTCFSLFSGQGETRRMNRAFGNAFVLVCFFEILLSVFLLLLTDPLLQLFGVTDTAYPYAVVYYRIVALGGLFQGLSQLFCDFVRVSGKPVLGMCVTGIGAVTNILLDGVFIIVFHWGVAGAALATVIGQFLSAAFGAFLVLGGHTLVKVSPDIFRLQKRLSGNILSCGFAFWVAQMAMGFISLVYNSQLGFVMLATTFFQSINRPVPSVLISLLRQVLFLVPFLYLLPLVWQINGIFFAQPISDLLATLFSLVLVLREQRRMYAKLPA